jgi:medium-chain acyl-[acyl-carrier-protein] hydrolase
MTGKCSSDWLPALTPNSCVKLRLFCFPYAGGADYIFSGWRKMLPETIEVCPVRLPGRAQRMQEEPFTNLPALVRAASSSLSSHLDKPFALFGHSMGALVCFELARQLRRDYGVRPAHLFVSACRSPQTATDDSPGHDLSMDDLMAMLRSPDGLPDGAAEDDELIDMLLPCLRADIAICRTYVYSPEPPLDCPITAFGGLQDNKISRDSLEGWREHTARSFHLRVLPGDHYFLHTSQLLLLRSITLDLSRHTA